MRDLEYRYDFRLPIVSGLAGPPLRTSGLFGGAVGVDERRSAEHHEVTSLSRNSSCERSRQARLNDMGWDAKVSGSAGVLQED
jgi:hypothetical protein